MSGSLGLLFPPSLPAIIYGVTAGVSVKDIFIAGLIPGILLLVMMSVWSLYQGKKERIAPKPFNFKKSVKACIDTKWELVIPVLILFGVFGGAKVHPSPKMCLFGGAKAHPSPKKWLLGG